MKDYKRITLLLIIHLWLTTSCNNSETKLLSPIATQNRIPSQIQLTEIGDFGIERKARPGIPSHLHTGIDIKRPGNNYIHEPIFPIATGTIISKRTDGPYAQLILEHKLQQDTFWTLYEHIAEILVEVGQSVGNDTEIARFFNREELDQHGWQFDHFHFEILNTPPIPIQPSSSHPQRYFRSKTLECFSQDELLSNFHDPVTFLKNDKD